MAAQCSEAEEVPRNTEGQRCSRLQTLGFWGYEDVGKGGRSEKNIQNTVLTCCVPETVSGSTKDPRHMSTKSSSVFHFPRQGLSKTWFSHHGMGIESTALSMNNLNFPKKIQ